MARTIAEMIQMLAKDGQQQYSLVCTVNSVDVEARTCSVSPLNEDPEIFDVRLQASIGSEVGWVIVPKVESFVIVTFLNNETAFVSCCTEVVNIFADVEETVIFNGGENGGLINVEDLVGRLNTIEQDINDLKDVFKSWVPVANDGGAKLKADASSWFGSSLEETERGDIEDEKIQH